MWASGGRCWLGQCRREAELRPARATGRLGTHGRVMSHPGLIGSALNLIRPMVKGQRRTVWWSLLGTTLLFDTGAHAVQYRKICTQVLKSGCPNIVALDGSKLMVRDESQTPLPASLSPRRFPCCMAERARGGVAGERLRDGRRAAATTGAHGGGVRQCTSV